MYNDDASRLVSEPTAGPLFSAQADDTDTESGTIYVLRSLSDHPFVAANRDLLHKIGVTGGSVESRIANAKLDPTFLMADVEIIATYQLYNINRSKLEKLIHRVFEPAKLDISIPDRLGKSVVPREWFLVPLFSINDAVEKIRQGDIDRWVYDKREARLVDTLTGQPS
ncbi:MAG: GIY-YIG nuclease family protein [Ahrensia sp.]